ncbi:hypothetical protein [Microcoleus sp. CAWBG58]|uniref:hypothetical protein n=1 Tax=Microcoleus sp. CAWBG58 TaxID=2841651 RepID=UPI0025FA6CB6|nr:hypothetical protein [Microcoleus sp. CAWBG58]
MPSRVNCQLSTVNCQLSTVKRRSFRAIACICVTFLNIRKPRKPHTLTLDDAFSTTEVKNFF